jgi:hypothetical protein
MTLSKNGNGALWGALKVKLAKVTGTFPSPEEWRGVFEHWDRATKPEERLRAVQQIRKAGGLPPDAVFYLVVMAVEGLAQERIDVSMSDGELKELGDRLDAIERAHGLEEDDEWEPGAAPPEWEALNAEWERVDDRITYDTYLTYDEREAGDLYMHNRPEFKRRADSGWQYFFGSE